MEPEKIEKIRELVNNQINELEKQISLGEESTQTVELDQSLAGRVSRIDAIQQQKMAQSSHQRDLKHLVHLKKTINRLSDEYFGRCEECDKAIPFARLCIQPESKYCIACQEAME